MDFSSIVLFLALYYIRPQEWMPFISILKPVTISMGMGIFAMFNREQGFSLRDVFKTPHDWLMLCYFLWVVITSPHSMDMLGRCYVYFVFYIVTNQALSNIERINKFLSWWSGLIWLVALMAVASEFGIDPMNSHDLTQGAMKGRLVLNTSIFNNPNALGHGVVPCLMMLYYAGFWKRPVVVKMFVGLLLFLPLYCIFLTASKGSFLAAFCSLVLSYSFGRPKAVQITILVLAVTVGYGALYNLPRMNELKKASTDPAIMGRLAAWQYGLDVIKTEKTGIGLGNFIEEFYKKHNYYKASHSSYVEIGTELGYFGLFLFLGILYCCVRTLVTAETTTVEEERARRVLFVLLCSYIVSSWMVDFGFRATYFLIAGAIAAFHRQMLLKNKPAQDEITEIEVQPVAFGLSQFRPLRAEPKAVADSIQNISINVPAKPVSAAALPAPVEANLELGGLKWNRLGLIDLVLMVLCVWGTVEFWRYIVAHL